MNDKEIALRKLEAEKEIALAKEKTEQEKAKAEDKRREAEDKRTDLLQTDFGESGKVKGGMHAPCI